MDNAYILHFRYNILDQDKQSQNLINLPWAKIKWLIKPKDKKFFLHFFVVPQKWWTSITCLMHEMAEKLIHSIFVAWVNGFFDKIEKGFRWLTCLSFDVGYEYLSLLTSVKSNICNFLEACPSKYYIMENVFVWI